MIVSYKMWGSIQLNIKSVFNATFVISQSRAHGVG